MWKFIPKKRDGNSDSAYVLVCEIGKPKILKKSVILMNHVGELTNYLEFSTHDNRQDRNRRIQIQ